MIQTDMDESRGYKSCSSIPKEKSEKYYYKDWVNRAPAKKQETDVHVWCF